MLKSAPSILQIQQEINRCRRQLFEADARLDALLAERAGLIAAIGGLTQLYQDRLNAGRLAEQGAAAVATVEGWLQGVR